MTRACAEALVGRSWAETATVYETPAICEDDIARLISLVAQGSEASSHTRCLARAAFDYLVERRTATLLAQLQRVESAHGVLGNGLVVDPSSLDDYIGREPCEERRRSAEALRLEGFRRIGSLQLEILKTVVELARQLSGLPYPQFMERLRGRPLAWTIRIARETLANTRDSLQHGLDKISRTCLMKPLRTLAPYDMPRLTELAAYPIEGCPYREVLHWLVEDFGFPPHFAAGATVVAGDNPTGYTRAFSANLYPRRSVVWLPKEPETLMDIGNLLHELGHAITFMACGAVSQDATNTFGDATVDEMFAMLFERLALNPAWRRRHFPCVCPGDDAGEQILQLLRMRRTAAMFLYESTLLSGDLGYDHAQQYYTAYLGEAFQFPVSPECCLAYIEPGFRAADYVEAMHLSVALEQRLRNLYGPLWFSQRSTRRFLEWLWCDGRVIDRVHHLLGIPPDLP